MNENQLFNIDGKRLYLTAQEREAFYQAAKTSAREIRTFCHTLHITGCRLSEALALTSNAIDLQEESITFRTLKKREKIHYRNIPVPSDYLDTLNMVHQIREAQTLGHIVKLWAWSRTTAWRHVKSTMVKARIDTTLPHASPKGLRHAYGIAAISAGMPLTELQRALGHADLRTTAIYLNALGEEKRVMYAKIWLNPENYR